MNIGTLGIDNIAVAFALGPLQLGGRRTWQLGLAFGCAEAGMALIGQGLGEAWLPAMVTADAAQAGGLATLAVAVLGLAWVRRRPAEFVGSPWALMVLALLLGLDNLIAGAASEASGVALTQAVASGVLIGASAVAACALGGALFRPARRWGTVACGVMLAGLAAAGIA